MSVKVMELNGKPVTTSLDVAESFERRHDNVLKDIRKIEARASKKFSRLHLEGVEYVDDKGQLRPMYNLTRDGWTMLVMGWSSEKAFEIKEQYIEAFNKMESRLKGDLPLDEWETARVKGKVSRGKLGATIDQYLIPLALSQGSKNPDKFWMVYTKMLNQIMVAKGYQRKYQAGDNVRNYLTHSELGLLDYMEDRMADQIKDHVIDGEHYKEVYQEMKRWAQRVVEVVGSFRPGLERRGRVFPLTALDSRGRHGTYLK